MKNTHPGTPAFLPEDRQIIELYKLLLKNLHHGALFNKEEDNLEFSPETLKYLAKIIEIRNKINHPLMEAIAVNDLSLHKLTFNDIIIILNFCKNYLKNLFK